MLSNPDAQHRAAALSFRSSGATFDFGTGALLLWLCLALVTAQSGAAAGGTVVVWGDNSRGQATVPANLSGVSAIAAGLFHTVALKSSGEVVAWGDNFYGQTNIPGDLVGVMAVAAGYGHTVALKSNGTVIAWGDNGSGQATVPTGLSGVTAIAAGGNHTLALKGDGTVVAWGDFASGQASMPAGLSGVMAIAVGSFHSVALKSNGTVVAWGYNVYGQATGAATPVPPALATANPVTLSGQTLSGVTAIAGGQFHTVSLKSNGTVVAWGDNFYGQTTGIPGTPPFTSLHADTANPVVLRGQTLSGVAAIAAGLNHTVVLKANGTMMAWGAGETSTGNNSELGQSMVPGGLVSVVAIAAGGLHTVALVGPAPAAPPSSRNP